MKFLDMKNTKESQRKQYALETKKEYDDLGRENQQSY